MSKETDCIVRMRGLPWTATVNEIKQFLEGCNVLDISFTYSDAGRPSGDAYVQFLDQEDFELALSKNGQIMGKRYVEVFRCSRKDMLEVLGRCGERSEVGPRGGGRFKDDEAVVRMIGLPFSCTPDDICLFFDGLEIMEDGISFVYDQTERRTGTGYVQFVHGSDAVKALQKHKNMIGNRYIEIYRSNLEEAHRDISGLSHNAPGALRYQNCNRFGPRPSPYSVLSFRGRPSSVLGGLTMGAGILEGGFGLGGFLERQNFDGLVRSGRGVRRGHGQGLLGTNSPGRSEYVSKTGHSIHMRGLPFTATTDDICKFFDPVKPVEVVLQLNDNGRPTGNADVDFSSHKDAKEALKLDRSNMGKRYIELYLKSSSHNEALTATSSSNNSLHS